jgi:hypothetical protein
MAVEKVYTCDLCGDAWPRGKLTRLGVRGLDDRPEDADNVDVGPCCQDKPVSDALAIARDAREEVTNGQAPAAAG